MMHHVMLMLMHQTAEQFRKCLSDQVWFTCSLWQQVATTNSCQTHGLVCGFGESGYRSKPSKKNLEGGTDHKVGVDEFLQSTHFLASHATLLDFQTYGSYPSSGADWQS